MTRELFFEGSTQAERTLRLFYDSENRDQITGDLDGEPLNIERVQWNLDSATVKIADGGTFTATISGDPEEHSQALRKYVESRPLDGYEIEILGRADLPTIMVGDRDYGPGLCVRARVTNGVLTDVVEFHFSKTATSVIARGATTPTDEQLFWQIRADTRRLSWTQIANRASQPHSVLMLAHPAGPYG